MDQRIRSFGEMLSQTAISRDWVKVHQLLAPWLRARSSASDVQEFFESDYANTLRANDIQDLHFPEIAQIDGNSSSLSSLREAPSWQPRGRPIPEEVNEANFRQWMNIQLKCSESQAEELDLDFLTDIWLVVVELEEGLRVGYWSHNPYEGSLPYSGARWRSPF